MIDFDVVLEKVGSFGTYQIAVFCALTYLGIPYGMNTIGPVFIAYTPSYRCYVFPFDNSSIYSEEIILNMTTPLDSEGDPKDSCVRYGYNVTECYVQNDLSCVNKSEDTIPCDQGYHYDDSLFTETVVTEFDLVCDRRIMNTVAGAMYMVGMLVGSLAYGAIADRFGRKIGIVSSCIGMLLFMLVKSFCHTVELYIVGEFFIGLFSTGCSISIFCHIMEIVGSNRRTLVGITYQSGFVIGYMLWSGVCYAWRDWHQMQLASFIIGTPLLVFVVLVPESPRWLFTTGKDEKGKKVISVMERVNKTSVDERTWEEAEKSGKLNQIRSEGEEKATMADLFRYPRIRLLTLKVGFSWAVNSMVYYGISLNAGSLAGDIFINNALAGVLEISSYVICVFIMDRVGRRLLLTVTLTGAGVGLLASTIANEYAGDSDGLVTLGVALAFIAKSLVSVSFAVVFNFTSEMYPTVLRSNGCGFGSMSARLGSILCPFLIGLQDYVSWLPNTIFGTAAIIGGLLSLSFRDTTGRAMMETIEEAELFHGGQDAVIIKNNMTQMYVNEVVENDDFKISTHL